MLLLITYDVDTTTAAGRKRLRKVSKVCVNYGQRVQNSVFECDADAATAKMIQAKLLDIIDLERDSLRFYNLGNQYQKRIEHFGAKPSYDPEGLLLI
jgi:CRISPR-associated protein Cas2